MGGQCDRLDPLHFLVFFVSINIHVLDLNLDSVINVII